MLINNAKTDPEDALKEASSPRDGNMPVFIIGYSLRAPNCSSVQDFANALQRGIDLTTNKTRYPVGLMGLPPRQGRVKDEDIASFDPTFFGVSHKQAEAMDPLIRILLKVSYEALLDAKVDIQAARGSRTGVYVGHCFSDIFSHNVSCFLPDKNGYELVNTMHSMAANRLSYFYDFKGPSLSIDTACSSSLVALDYAVRDLESGVVDRAVVAGLSLTLNHHKNASFNAFKALSPTGRCYSFDTRANGYCRSDGVACVVLERGLAQKDDNHKGNQNNHKNAYAIVAGTGTNSDGSKPKGITYPSAAQQANLMKQVFAKSSIAPDSVGFHEAHGTGTTAGDREELEGLSQVYNHGMYIGSVKSNMGHAEGASGLLGLIKILLMFEQKEIFPNHDFRESPHSKINDGSFTVLQQTKPWHPQPCSISNFGFGGSNAFALLVPVDSPLAMHSAPMGSQGVVPFSASKDISTNISSSFGRYYALQRSIGNHRSFPFQLKDGEWEEYSPLVFVCDGQGSHWINMGKDLMTDFPIFRATMERLGSETGLPLVQLYEDGTQWLSKENSIVGIVSFQLGLIAILRDCGIYPDYFLGHSVGELVCSYLAGLATEIEVLQFALVRAKVVKLLDPKIRLDVYKEEPEDGFDYKFKLDSTENTSATNGVSTWAYAKRVSTDAPPDPLVIQSFTMDGQMVAVGTTSDVIENSCNELSLQETRVACHNSPRGQTVSGPRHEVQKLLQHLRKKSPNTFIAELNTDNIAYHAIYLKVFQEFFRQEFPEVKASRLPPSWISTSRSSLFNDECLINNICEPVYFKEAIESLPPGATAVEIGPSQGMLAHIKRTRRDISLIGLVDKWKKVDLSRSLERLKPWSTPHPANIDAIQNEANLPVNERYPQLWSTKPTFRIPSWKEFEMNEDTCGSSATNATVTSTDTSTDTLTNPTDTSTLIFYDLTDPKWSSLRDHTIRGQNLFPATGFIHAIWSTVCFEKGYELQDFRIHSPLVISSSSNGITLRLEKADRWCAVFDDEGKICHATAQIQPIPGSLKPFDHPDMNKNEKNRVEGHLWYNDIKRIGYEYGTLYQVLDGINAEGAFLSKKPSDWISYLDVLVHLFLFGSDSFAYPVGFDRVAFWSSSLGDADLWVTRPLADSVGNSTVQLEGLRMEYMPTHEQAPSIHQEVFIEYGESTKSTDATLIAGALVRESRSYCIPADLKSLELQLVAAELDKHPLVTRTQTTSLLVLSDSFSVMCQDGGLLLTDNIMDPPHTHVLVSRWGSLSLYRIRDSVVRAPKTLSSWQEAKMQSEEFVWTGSGSSGAVASLRAETRDKIKAHSYNGCTTTEGINKVWRKGMCHNFIMEDGRHGVWVDQNQTSLLQKGLTASCAKLKVLKPGRLDSLYWEAIDGKTNTVQTTVATLNFRDVMRAIGRLKEKDLSLGLEFAGVQEGKRVFGVTKHALSTNCCPMYSYPTPTNFTDEEAATIPVVYLTVYYALFEKANMKAGQSVLIHAGTGGVGMAAITVAQKRGLKVFTTCSEAKREYLKAKFHLNDEQIGDSRSDSFVGTVMKGTMGRGVDVVLNQLAGPLQIASLRCLAPGGHFCEIGKYDILQNTGLAQGLLTANISFHVIDLLPLLCDSREKVRWDAILEEGFEKEEIVPLPTTAFDAGSIEDAFRFMSQGKHLGKIVITGLAGRDYPVAQPVGSVSSETHLITGGLGGLGLALAGRLAREGVSRVILVGRSAVKNGFQRWKIKQIEELGCEVEVLQTDLLTLSANACLAPDRIWHAATIYRDTVLADMTAESWDMVVRTKVEGYKRLRRVWPDTPVVCFSSVAAYFGNAMQTSYSAANAMLDEAARTDSNTTTVRLGPLDNVGFITKGQNHRSLFDRVPFSLMSIDGVLSSIMRITSMYKSGVFGVYDLKEATETSATRGNKGMNDEKRIVQTKVSGERASGVKEYCLVDAQKLMSTVLGGSLNHYKATTVLTSAGLDSLSTMEVVHHIHDQSGSTSFKPSDITDHFTIQDLIDTINQERTRTGSVPGVSHEDMEDDNVTEDDNRMIVNDVMAVRSSKSTSDGPNNDETPSKSLLVKFPGKRGQVSVSIPPYGIDFEAVHECLEEASVVVFRQQDKRVFNHGAPVDSGHETAVVEYLNRYVRLAHALEKSNATIVTVVEGEVRGGGMIFLAMADVCVATDRASFGLPEIHRNMVPSVVAQALVERLGKAATRRLSLTGESFDSNEALRLGLIDKLVDQAHLERHVDSLLRRWEPRANATHFIKSELLPKEPSKAMSMGTVAGQWLQQKAHRSSLDARKVLDVSIEDGVAVLTMCDDVYQNTMTFEMTDALRRAIPQVKGEAKVIILASSLTNFHVGLNPSRAREWKNKSTLEVAANMKECYMGFVELATLGIPIIGVLNGKVYGGGLPIALWCDYRIVTNDVDVHFGNISRGMSPAGQLSRLLREYLSPSRIMEAYLENSHWSSQELLDVGIASQVLPSWKDAMDQATSLARFIARQPTQAVRDTMHLVKLSYAADVANEEAWLIANKITTTKEPFSTRQHDSFPSIKPSRTIPPNPSVAAVKTSNQPLTAMGIIAMEVYTPAHGISASTLEENGIRARSKQGQEAVSIWDAQEDSISMAMNAVSKLLERHVDDPYKIGRIEVGTESNVDMAKSIKSYLMSLLPSDHYDVEGVDNTNACYGGTAALLNSLSWCRETGKHAIVVATDTADMDVEQSGWRGASAVAMLVGQDPWIEVHRERVSCFKNTKDFMKPRFSEKLTPYIQTKASMDHYIHALDYTIDRMEAEHGICVGEMDAFVFHGGLCATFMKLIERHLMKKTDIKSSWKVNFDDARHAASLMGGLYTASMYVNLVSLLSRSNDESLRRLCLFSYGSGSTATLLHATVHPDRSHDLTLLDDVANRTMVSYGDLKLVAKEAMTQEVLKRKVGVFYRKLSEKTVARTYYREEGLKPQQGTIQRPATSSVQLDDEPTSSSDGVVGIMSDIRSFLANVLDLETNNITDTTPLGELGLDSITGTQLANNIKTKYDVDLSLPEIFAFHTLRDLVEKLGVMTSETKGVSLDRGVVAESSFADGIDEQPDCSVIETKDALSMNKPVAEGSGYSSSGQSNRMDTIPWSKKLEIVEDAWRKEGTDRITQLELDDDHLDGRIVTVKGKQCVNFGQCCYSGIEFRTELVGGAASAMKRFGLQLSVSRRYMTTPLYGEAESLLSRMTGAHCIVAATTTLIHLAVLPTLVMESDVVLIDSQAHMSIQQTAKVLNSHGTKVLTMTHNSMDAVEEALLAHRDKKVWYFSDGVYSMYGDAAPLLKLKALHDRHDNLHLYIDDAHGFGWYGKHGRGIAMEVLSPLTKRIVVVASLSKAFAAGGGVAMLSTAEARDRVLNLGGPLVFGGPVQIPVMGAQIASARLHLSDEFKDIQKSLQDRIKYCTELLLRAGLPLVSKAPLPIRYVGCGAKRSAFEISRRIQRDGFYVNAAVYPAVPLRKSGIRFTLTNHQTMEDIENLVVCMKKHFVEVIEEEAMSLLDLHKMFKTEMEESANGNMEFQQNSW